MIRDKIKESKITLKIFKASTLEEEKSLRYYFCFATLYSFGGAVVFLPADTSYN